MDTGSHSNVCAEAVSGVCHCDCHGARHGIAHLAGAMADRAARITATAVKDGGKITHYQVTGPDGLPPGGGTREERVAHRAEQVAVTATAPRSATPRRLDTYAKRRDAAREHDKMTRDQFDQAPAHERARILAELKDIAASSDTSGSRDRYGVWNRGTAQHVGTAKALLVRFTTERRAPVDNSPEGRAARISAAKSPYEVGEALWGATKADMQEIAMLNRWGPWSSGWTVAKWRTFITARATGKH